MGHKENDFPRSGIGIHRSGHKGRRWKYYDDPRRLLLYLTPNRDREESRHWKKWETDRRKIQTRESGAVPVTTTATNKSDHIKHLFYLNKWAALGSIIVNILMRALSGRLLPSRVFVVCVCVCVMCIFLIVIDARSSTIVHYRCSLPVGIDAFRLWPFALKNRPFSWL